MVDVVKETVAVPLEFVEEVVGNVPPVPALLQVTEMPFVATALPYWSASCALTIATAPATGL